MRTRALCVVVGCVLWMGCGGVVRGDGAGARGEIRQESASGGGGNEKLVMVVSAGAITVAERVTVRLEVEGGRGTVVSWPEIGGGAATAVGEGGEKSAVEVERKLGPWRVVSVRDEGPVVVGGTDKLRWRRVLVLEPFLAGEYEVPAIAVGIGGGKTLTTTAAKVVVTSLLGAEVKEGSKELTVGEPRGVVELGHSSPYELGRTAGKIMASAVAIGVGVGAVLLIRRPRKVSVLEGAIAELEGIAAGGAGSVSHGAWDAIARAVRAGIAERVEPRAVGMSAGELVEAARSANGGTGWPAFGVGEVASLRRVLETCDDARFGGEGDGAGAVNAKEAASVGAGLLRGLLTVPALGSTKGGPSR